MKNILLTVFVIFLTSVAVLISVAEEKLTPTEKTAQTGGVVCYGMSREDLCELYMYFLDKKYQRDGDREWITFSGCPTEDPADTMTFYLEGGKVKDWYKGGRR